MFIPTYKATLFWKYNWMSESSTDLDNLENITLRDEAMQDVNTVLVRSIAIMIVLWVDVPFRNGTFDIGFHALYELFSDHIDYDSGIMLMIVFNRINWICQ